MRIAVAIGFTLPLLAGAAVLTPLTMMAGMVGSQRKVDFQLASSCTINQSDLTVDELDGEQIENAGVVVATAKSLGVSTRGQMIAIAAAFQESRLRNLAYGDQDSLGLFQQRPSSGWGQPADVTDPEYAARAFFGGPQSPSRNKGLLDLEGWETMPLWEAAQTVQRSAYPTAYAVWEGLAYDVVAQLGGDHAACQTLAAGPWTLPLPVPSQLTSDFGPRTSPTTGWPDFHTGQDFAAPAGSPVMAATAGDVSWAGPDGTYGNLVRLEHADGLETYYAHLSEISVVEGDHVDAHQLIGETGNSGNSNGAHLHFEIRLNGEPTDPLEFLREKGLQP